MERITGRVAITVMAELDLGYRNLTDAEVLYVHRQAAGFRDWLVNNQHKTIEEAKEICRELYEKDCALLQEVDPYADIIWSRGQEVGQAEIDLSLIANMDFEQSANEDHKAHVAYWGEMERRADKYHGKKSPEQWRASEEKFNEAFAFLKELVVKYQHKKLTTKDHVYLAKVNRRVNQLRFGREPLLMFSHWAICHNVMVAITGSGKVIPVKEPRQRDDEVDEDAMSLVQRGVDIDTMHAGSTGGDGDGEEDRET